MTSNELTKLYEEKFEAIQSLNKQCSGRHVAVEGKAPFFL